jgi:ribosome maturation factor RimP
MGGVQELFELLEREVASQGVELVEVSLGRSGSRTLVRLVIHSLSGVSHGDCTRVTAVAARALERAERTLGSYRIEVSSPGTGRVLRGAREFEIFRGRRVQVWIQGSSGLTEVIGRSRGNRAGEGVLIEKETGELTVLPWSEVAKARLVPEAPGEVLGEKR